MFNIIHTANPRFHRYSDTDKKSLLLDPQDESSARAVGSYMQFSQETIITCVFLYNNENLKCGVTRLCKLTEPMISWKLFL